ncbi:MAG: nicotinate-nucleotide--dimethylbenzimidazole phosphoribosyltransferase [Nitrospirae bacterium]|nr:MAG: nicotinate-nucleotide--dimethylbenzimidazole phosphoribosyltransferase [Nitrospirota bacterium]
MILSDTIRAIVPIDTTLLAKAQARLDRLTKPVGSLGRLEELAARVIAILGAEPSQLPQSMVLTFVADHGVTAEGISAYPSSVTAQMVWNFLKGGAAVNVLARHVGAQVRVVDIGVAEDLGRPEGLVVRKIGYGTKNMARGPAMTCEEAIKAVETGIKVALDAVKEGMTLLATGEMGIGNTTASAAIATVMTGQPLERMTGRGTGLDDAGLAKKRQVIHQALTVNRPDPHDPLDVLAKVGGFEIGGMAGMILAAAANRIPVVLDGFIAGAAALLAVAWQPRCRDYLIASHVSDERGHAPLLQHLGLAPLLDLRLRLGEGTGACLAINLVQAALKVYREMATFQEAGVDEALPPTR